MSSKKKKRIDPHVKQKAILISAIIVIVILIGYFYVIKPAGKDITSNLTKKLIASQLPDDPDADTEELLNYMDEEDQELIEDIVNNHISVNTISDVFSYIADGDIAGLKKYAKNSLTDDELEQLKEIYEKYQDEITERVLNQ